MTALLAKATALALVKHPVVNSSCRDGKSFTYNSSINIAVAVAIDGGLITPVLQDADKVTLILACCYYLSCRCGICMYAIILRKGLSKSCFRLTYIHCQENGRSWLIRPGPSSCNLMNTIQVSGLIHVNASLVNLFPCGILLKHYVPWSCYFHNSLGICLSDG